MDVKNCVNICFTGIFSAKIETVGGTAGLQENSVRNFSTTGPMITEFSGDFSGSPGCFLLVYFASSIHVFADIIPALLPFEEPVPVDNWRDDRCNRLIRTSTT